MAYLIGVDLGTSGTKTALFDERGRRIASRTVEYPLSQPKNGWAEQEPEHWWKAACETIRAVIAESGVDADAIKGVGLSGQMHGLVMLDAAGQVLRPAILWCDGRTGEECREITERVGRQRLIDITANPALTGFTAGKILWVRKHEPENYERCRHILLPKDYLRYKLTGEFATEVSDASGMNLLDVPKRQWSQEILDALEMDRALLGRMYESCEVTGEVTAEAARLTGLKEGTPVAGGAGDNAAAAMSCTLSAGLSLQWFRNNFCSEERAEAERLGVDPHDVMTAEAAKSPVGANRLIYLPYLMGERSPLLDEQARGAFVGLSAMHTRGDLIRAVMEGVTYSQRQCLDILRRGLRQRGRRRRQHREHRRREQPRAGYEREAEQDIRAGRGAFPVGRGRSAHRADAAVYGGRLVRADAGFLAHRGRGLYQHRPADEQRHSGRV